MCHNCILTWTLWITIRKFFLKEGLVVVQKFDKAASGEITGLTGKLHLEGNFKTTKLKLTWLADIGDLVPLRLLEFDHLISKKKLEEGDDITDFVTPVSVS